MQGLKATSKFGKGRFSHSHIIYINDATQKGGCSFSLKHTHEVQWIPPIEPDIDELSGQELSPGIPGYWALLPAEDGHTHELQEYELEDFKPEETEEEVIQSVYRAFTAATDIERESIEDGDIAEEFYFGRQWSDEQREKLSEDNRACLTLNLIQPKINELCGYEREQRTLWRFVPVEGGDQIVADALNVVTNIIAENSYYDREKSRIFEDMVIAGRGLFHVYLDRTKDIRGEIRIESFPWRDARFGPHEKEDLSDCEDMIKHKMFAMSKLRQLWPEKADLIKNSFDALAQHHGATNDKTTQDSYFDTQNLAVSIGGTAMVDFNRKEYRVLERHSRVYFPTFVLANAEEDFYLNCLGWKESDVKQAETIPGFVAFPTVTQKMRISTVCGGTLLSDQYPAKTPKDDFSIVPVYGIKRGDRFQGKVANAIDAQKEMNVRHSQAVDIGNRHITNGWFYTSNTFPDGEKKKFKDTVAKAGFTIETNSKDDQPTRIEGGVFPPMLVDLMNVSEQRINQTLSVTVESQGSHDSGSKLMMLQQNKLKGSEHLFDNIAFAQKKVAQLVVALIQENYTAERLYRMLVSRAEREQIKLGGQDVQSIPREELIYMLETMDLSTMDVVVAEQSYSPTARLANFLLLSDLAGKGAPIPPEMLIELVDMPQDFKNRILQGIQAQKEAEAQAERDKQQSEVMKTAVAKGLVDPTQMQSDMSQQEQPSSDQGGGGAEPPVG